MLFGPQMKLKVREDNEATAKVVTAGYSKKIKYLRRTQKISLASPAEELSKDDVSLALVRTSEPKADVFTKAVAGPLWPTAMDLMALIKTCEIISSTQTGLKLASDFNEALGQTAAPPVRAAAYKKKQKRRPQRTPLYTCE